MNLDISRHLELPNTPSYEMDPDLFDNYKEVNRLIILGNGFDLAHGLKSRFVDFINDYCYNVIETFIKDSHYQDPLLYLHESNAMVSSGIYLNNRIVENSSTRLLQLFEQSKDGFHGQSIAFKWTSTLLQNILKEVQEKNWVDIEVLYFEELKKYANSSNGIKVLELNKQLDYFKNELLTVKFHKVVVYNLLYN